MTYKRLMSDKIFPSNLLYSYRKYENLLRVKSSTTGCILSIILMPSGLLLDYFSYPNLFYELLNVRIVSWFIMLLILGTHYTKLGKNNITLLMFSWITLDQIFMCYLIFLTEKYLSHYYAGLNLVILFISIILPLKFYEITSICLMTLGLYFLAAWDSKIENFGILFSNVYFILVTSIISITASQFRYKLRFKEFCLHYELEEKNNQLAKMDEMKTQFFANISHEFRTPLTLILGPIQNILHDSSNKISESIKTNLNIAQNNSFRLLRLVNDLLDIISLEKGKLKLVRQKEDISSLLKAKIEAISHLAKMKDINLIHNICESQVFVKIDENAFDKIILNIVNNAIKFTPSGGVVEIKLEKNKENAVITVTDNGIGIEEKELAKIFEPFKQADGSHTRKYQGTGLGLALVKELTELQNGEVEIESKIDEGTKIILTFKIDNSQDIAIKKTNNDKDEIINIHKTCQIAHDIYNNNTELSNNKITKNHTILIVDDEPDMLNFIAKIISNEGYKIILAKDGKNAIDLARQNIPDIIILDLMLPEIDGLGVCKILKEDPKLQFSKIILLTAKADEESKIQALKNGADDFITKPFSNSDILTRIENLLQNQKLFKVISGDLEVTKDDLKKSLGDLKKMQQKLINSEKLNVIGNLTAGIIHEINNPLNYTLTGVELLKRNEVAMQDEEIKDIILDIEDGANRIRNIVLDLKSFAYPKEGEMKKEFLVYESIKSAIKITSYDNKEVKMINKINPELRALGSINHITQVVINLIVNATKAIKDSQNSTSGKIEIDSVEENGQIIIRIADNGKGMSQETIDQIFTPFFTTKKIGEGVGLGLDICKTIIKNHNGELKVQSQEGLGAIFSFSLPKS